METEYSWDEASWRRWREARLRELAGPESWFGLVGLEPGQNAVGSATGCLVHLPSGPARLGELIRSGEAVVWRAAPGIEGSISGTPAEHAADGLRLHTDIGGAPTVLESGRLRLFVIHREGHPAARVKDLDWATRRHFAGIDSYPFDPAWVIEAAWEALPGPGSIEIHTMTGAVKQVPVRLHAIFERGGNRLWPLEDDDRGAFFVSRDATSAKDTYGGGRFLRAGAGRGHRPRLQPRLQPPLRLHPLCRLPAPAAGEPAWDCGEGGREAVSGGGVRDGHAHVAREVIRYWNHGQNCRLSSNQAVAFYWQLIGQSDNLSTVVFVVYFKSSEAAGDMIEWDYSANLPRDRVSALLAPTTIGTIANRIVAEMEIACCHFQSCDDHANFRRVAYCVQVSEDLFDLFFNSPHGYRGAYFRSPGEGVDANSTLIGALAPKLLAMSAAGASEEELTRVRESLSSSSAKAWLAEKGLGICPKCEGEWGPHTDTVPEILNGRWELGQAGPQCDGRKAPRFTKIRVFGGFLDDRNNEFVPCRKRHRAKDIHLWGWS